MTFVQLVSTIITYTLDISQLLSEMLNWRKALHHTEQNKHNVETGSGILPLKLNFTKIRNILE